MDPVDPNWIALVHAGVIEWPPKEIKEMLKKKPWELTKREWWARTLVKHDEKEIILELPNGKIKRTGLKPGNLDTYVKYEKLLMEIAFEAQKEEVKEALRNGKYVPREVVREVLGE